MKEIGLMIFKKVKELSIITMEILLKENLKII